MLWRCRFVLFAPLAGGIMNRGHICRCSRLWPSSAAFIDTRHIRFAHNLDRRRLSHQIFASPDDDGSSNNKVDNTVYEEGRNLDQLKTRFRARVAYCGTPYHGWQLQPGRSTVQGELEAVLALRFRRRAPVLGAGRTDAGVHARGQSVHFDLLYPGEIPFVPPPRPTGVDSTETPIEGEEQQKCTDFCNELQHSMNRMLPLDIRVFNLQLAPYTWTSKGAKNDDGDDNNNDENAENEREQEEEPSKSSMVKPWHAIANSNAKWYSYRFTLGPTLWNPMDRFTRTYFVHRPLFAPPSSNLRPSKSASIEPYELTKQDIDKLQKIFRLYEGTHDFKAFGGQIEQNEKRAMKKINTIRTVYRVELVKEPLKEDYDFGNESVVSPPLQEQLGFIGEEGNYRIDFLLQGALYKMVRNMVGTAIECWLGRMSEEQLVELLQEQGATNELKLGRKDNPCKPAPPEGLTLETIYYDDNF